jgi:anaerobic ribonucleoside-triphosphate reductase activating protein
MDSRIEYNQRKGQREPAPMQVRVAQIVECTAAEGPGKRFAIWFQGCPLRCTGCCNPEMLPFTGGEDVDVAEIAARMQSAVGGGIEGITLLGGEPFTHASGAAALAFEARQLGLSVMVFSGYTLEELRARADRETESLLALTDILVDGRYERDLPETSRRWIGSANQRIHFLTERYRADAPCWSAPDTLELRWDGRELVVNGFPAPRAATLWKRLR